MAIIRDESIEEYHANKSVSHTGLKDFGALGPAGYFHRHVGRTNVRECTTALRHGQQFENVLDGIDLQVAPETIADPAPEPKPWSNRRKVCREWKAACPEDVPPAMIADPAPAATAWSGNRTVCREWMAADPRRCSQSDADMFERMRGAVMGNATARSMLERAERQVTFRADYPGLPAGFQSRPDYVISDPFLGDVIIDLKTLDSLDHVRRNIYKYGYASQAGLAVHHARLAGMEPAFYLLVVEKLFPTRAVLLRLSDRTLATGWAWCEEKLDQLAEHYGADHWPPTVSDVEDVDAPIDGYEQEGTP